MNKTLNRLIRRKLTVLAILASSTLTNAAVDVTTDIATDTTWSLANSPYTLKDYIFVTSGATLTIEPGVTIYADEGTTTEAPALIITQGSKIDANGTAAKPIIFTSSLEKTQVLTKEDKGKWGGLVILGKAKINANKQGSGDGTNTTPMVWEVEGLPTAYIYGSGTISAANRTYGGSDDTDNSGVLRYVSIRHGGAIIGANNELNGLTLGGVGSGTTIEYIDVYANKDDGIEFFGGTVNAKYLSVCFVGDDSFDIDDGYKGHLQYLFTVQDSSSNCAFEWDGASESDDKGYTADGALEYSYPFISNVTAIGAGATTTGSSSKGLDIRDNAGGIMFNSIFTEFPETMLKIEKTATTKGTVNAATGSAGSQALLETNLLGFKGVMFYNAGDGNTDAGVVNDSSDAAAVSPLVFDAANKNLSSTDPKLLDDDSNDTYALVLPFPGAGSPALSDYATVSDTSYITQTTYKGAFADATPSSNWMAGWTAYSDLHPNTYFYYTPTSTTSSSTSSAGRIFGMSLRGNISDLPVAGGMTIDGTGTVKVLIRVKGPSMSGVSGSITDPKITITKLNTTTNAYDAYLTVDSATDHADTAANYSDRGTGNPKEPHAVVDLSAGTYGVRVTDAAGGTGHTNVEFYIVE